MSRIFLFCFVFGASVLGVSCGSDGSSGSSSSNGNVNVEAMCSVPRACGGDPTGTWELVEGCVEPPPGGFECESGLTTAHGSATGTFTFGAGSFDSTVDSEMRQCGWVDSSGDGAGGSWAVSGDVIDLGGVRPLEFCVEGDTLWLVDSTAEYPDLVVMRLERSAGG